MKEIDLGVDNSERFNVGMPPMKEGMEKHIEYPRFTYSGPEELELPEEGEMTIRFKKKSETSRTREDGSHWYECDIEVQCICDCEEEEEEEVEAPSRSYNEAEEALDTLARALKRDNE